MTKKIFVILLATWAILSVGALAQFLYDSAAATDQWVRGELEVRLGWGLIILNFPLSLVASLLLTGTGGPIAEWCVLTLVGFVQWAFLLPALGRALRSLVARLRSQTQH
jgi:hypothetical protein